MIENRIVKDRGGDPVDPGTVQQKYSMWWILTLESGWVSKYIDIILVKRNIVLDTATSGTKKGQI